ncbi:hypothetical protein [Pedobacter jejuensis]|nr:hypothetical protein [Pedobacter jejuensis]
MKKILIALVICLGFGCSENNQKKVDSVIDDTSDSLVAKVDQVGDSLKRVKDDIKSKIPKFKIDVIKTIPISLQWISFEKQGSAQLKKQSDGWFSIKGEQTNANNEFLRLDGKIKRLDANQLSFEGTIITYIKDNNGGKPCEKTGTQIFAKKGDRNYYRLQNMENCSGGKVLDYVDIYDVDQVVK